MNHLMHISERDSSRNSLFGSNNSNTLQETKLLPPSELYIGQIPNDIDGNSLTAFFSQFGEIERIFEGGRRPSGGMKWAFVSYVHPEDAFKYLPLNK